jgi:hypothetical protein
MSAAGDDRARRRWLCGCELSVSCAAHAAARAFEDRPGRPLRQARVRQRSIEITWEAVAKGNQAAKLVNIGAVDNAHGAIPSMISAGGQI